MNKIGEIAGVAFFSLLFMGFMYSLFILNPEWEREHRMPKVGEVVGCRIEESARISTYDGTLLRDYIVIWKDSTGAWIRPQRQWDEFTSDMTRFHTRLGAEACSSAFMAKK